MPRRAILLLVGLFTAGGATPPTAPAAPTAAPAAATTTLTCKGVSGFDAITRLRAVGTTCTAARRVARAYRADEEEECAVAEECFVLSYRCTQSDRRISYAQITCRRAGGRRVTFRLINGS